ncbi:diguanylate cyclase domain-containing protein [Pseudidiomarina woesei]|uniref:Diguanylate cyclase (GGDEF) domain n=1 Tax=Pseudidiomarina woesei TaxID=1381080 RepID=A0A0K6H1Y0_9GAMM|nr:diguanylate cyclase [Pseudidiomarina woesei]CUA84895.1 diguanylate cyclase (GGDEF) domain [Pseudidiomarina woesei]
MFVTRPKRIVFIVAVLSSLALALVSVEYFHSLNKERAKAHYLSETQTEFTKLRADIESEINLAIYSAWGFASYLTSHPTSSPAEWQRLAQDLIDQTKFVRNLAVAPNNIIEFVYPLKNNEAIIGFDYDSIPEQRDAVRRAQETQKTILAGPVSLIQGGQGLIYRIPVFTHTDQSQEYWGVIAVVVDVEALFAEVGLHRMAERYDIAMRGRDGLGAQGDIFLGSADTFTNANLTERVRFPNGYWLLALAADANEVLTFWQEQRVRLIGYPYVLALYIMLFTLFLWYRASYGEAMVDPLTNVANRRKVMEQLNTLVNIYGRHPTPFTVVVIDIDRFKQINDQFGHQAGDTVLKSLAHRMLVNTRTSDLVARIGGDEFLVVLMGVDNPKIIAEQCNKLAQAIREPVSYKSQLIEVSASLGHASFPADGETLDALIHSADHKMYKQKRNA